MVIEMSRKGRNRRKLMSEINMTPLIDVMLVLLVIFMITAPLLTSGIKVNLPNAFAPTVNTDESPIIVSVKENGDIFLGDVEVNLAELPAKLSAISMNRSEQPKIFVKGDKSNLYGGIMKVMGQITVAGFKKVVLVTENSSTSSVESKNRIIKNKHKIKNSSNKKR